MNTAFVERSGEYIWSFFLAVFTVFAVWETLRPRTRPVLSTARRWLWHGLLLVAGNWTAQWVFRIGSVGVALAVAESPYGLLNRSWLPLPVRFVLTLLAVDLLHYAVHVGFHRFPWLWRFHQVHHSDADYDLTTGLRFHPVETILTEGLTLLAVGVLAPPPIALLIAQLITLAQDLFEHSNVRVPERVVRWLRPILITPELHRVHHALEVGSQNTNFGTIFPWWDRLGGTYNAVPCDGGPDFPVGLITVAPETSLKPSHILLAPFRSQSAPRPQAAEAVTAASAPTGATP
ncbi:MAG: sterol desaturase family protein [Bryobacter sp.]|nr:sterol desaturase family protein [Bryobacter sp.]